MRPQFFPFAVAATAILAVNALLFALGVPYGHVAMPIVALGLLLIAVVLWIKGT